MLQTDEDQEWDVLWWRGPLGPSSLGHLPPLPSLSPNAIRPSGLMPSMRWKRWRGGARLKRAWRWWQRPSASGRLPGVVHLHLSFSFVLDGIKMALGRRKRAQREKTRRRRTTKALQGPHRSSCSSCSLFVGGIKPPRPRIKEAGRVLKTRDKGNVDRLPGWP